MTQKAAARRLGVNQGTLARWEQGKREPAGAFLGRVKRFLSEKADECRDSRRVG
jgi:transcriptional regulator with XRE-family HTH domain